MREAHSLFKFAFVFVVWKSRQSEGGRRRWLNRAAAASVCVLKNGDYDLGAEYFDLSFFSKLRTEGRTLVRFWFAFGSLGEFGSLLAL